MSRPDGMPGGRRQDENTRAKMRMLWGILFILIIILAVAIVYEIILGNGTRETGSQRMGESGQESELVLETESAQAEQLTESWLETDSGQETESEKESGQEPEAGLTSAAEAEMDVKESEVLSDEVTLAGVGD